MRPDFRIEVNGIDKTRIFQDRLLSLEVVDNAGMEADTLMLRFDDRGYALPLPAFGEELKLWLGYIGEDTELVYVGLFTVDESTVNLSPKTLSISAKSADMMESLKVPHTQSWHEVGLADIAGTIAQKHGLRLRIDERLQSVSYPHVDQSEESDLHFLTRLVRDVDAMVKVADAALIIVPNGTGKAASGQALPRKTLAYSELLPGGSVNQKGRSRFRGAQCQWRDVAKAATETVQVGSAPFYEIREPAASEDLAYQKAVAKQRQLQRGEGSINVSIGGDTSYAAGMVIDLDDGFKPDLVGSEWFLLRVVHRYESGSGFVTSIEGEVPNQQ